MLKAASAIREVVSMAILTELKDPRVRNVTVTFVEVAPDMRTAKVHVSIMGNETQQSLSLRGLQSSAGFLQQRLSKEIDTRYTPRLQFVLDKGVKHSIEVARMLRELLPGEAATPPTDDTLAAADDTLAAADEEEFDDELDDDDDELDQDSDHEPDVEQDVAHDDTVVIPDRTPAAVESHDPK